MNSTPCILENWISKHGAVSKQVAELLKVGSFCLLCASDLWCCCCCQDFECNPCSPTFWCKSCVAGYEVCRRTLFALCVSLDVHICFMLWLQHIHGTRIACKYVNWWCSYFIGGLCYLFESKLLGTHWSHPEIQTFCHWTERGVSDCCAALLQTSLMWCIFYNLYPMMY